MQFKFKTIKFFERETYTGVIMVNNALESQTNLKDQIDEF